MKRRLLLSLALLLGILYFSAGFWAPWFGTYLLDATSNPTPAAAVVVLAGDGFGLRILKGAELVRDGIAPVAFVSGPSHVYDVSEAGLAIDFAVRRGFDRAKFEAIPLEYYSTEEEAAKIAAEIRKRGLRNIIVVTSNYHTRRAGRLWREAAAGTFNVQVVAAPDKDLKPEIWWDNREGRKKIFYEWVKVITSRLGL